MNLRFIIRDGQKILQQQIEIGTIDDYPDYDDTIKGGFYCVTKPIMEWVDVPLVVEGDEE